MRILFITHADFETPGIIETWAKGHQYPVAIARPFRGETMPAPESFDVLIIMGGPQSAVEVDQYPYLNEEVALIKKAIQANKKIFGICLGAQLIGIALGVKAERSPEKEIGVYPVQLTDAGLNDPLLQGFSASIPMIHWHNDMPGLTKEAVLLAYTPGCPRQIIRYLPHVYGFQCHLEITRDNMQGMATHAVHDLKPSRYTQTYDELMQHDYDSINQCMMDILNRFVVLKTTASA